MHPHDDDDWIVLNVVRFTIRKLTKKKVGCGLYSSSLSVLIEYNVAYRCAYCSSVCAKAEDKMQIWSG